MSNKFNDSIVANKDSIKKADEKERSRKAGESNIDCPNLGSGFIGKSGVGTLCPAGFLFLMGAHMLVFALGLGWGREKDWTFT